MCVCIALWAIVVHNIAQNRPDNFPPYPPIVKTALKSTNI